MGSSPRNALDVWSGSVFMGAAWMPRREEVRVCPAHWGGGSDARRFHRGIGRGERIRTSDPLHPMQVRYQAALRPDRAANYSLKLAAGRCAQSEMHPYRTPQRSSILRMLFNSLRMLEGEI